MSRARRTALRPVSALGRAAMLLLAVSLSAFLLLKLSPIDPVDAYLGPAIATASDERRAAIADAWGLNEPVAVQFTVWLGHVLSGDLGWSTAYDAPVVHILVERGAASLALALPAWLLSGVLGFALGLVAAVRENSAADRVVRLSSYVMASAPTFWVAILAITFFSVSLGWTPVCCSGPIGTPEHDVTALQRLHHLVLPLAVLSVVGTAQIALHTRAKALEIMRSDFVLLARAQGASNGDIVLRHVARNAALPATTLLFASIGEIFGGAILAEQVFAYPGLGRATIEAGLTGDVPLLLAITLASAALVGLGNLVADDLHRRIDPRLRSPGGGVAEGLDH